SRLVGDQREARGDEGASALNADRRLRGRAEASPPDAAGREVEMTRIAFLGAGGTMGLPMARNLARGGFEVCAWNRSPEKAAPLADEGVDVVESVADAIDGAEVLITMLSDAEAVEATVNDAP